MRDIFKHPCFKDFYLFLYLSTDVSKVLCSHDQADDRFLWTFFQCSLIYTCDNLIFYQMYFRYVQILHYSTIFWKLISPEMRHNCWLDLLKSRWISLFLLSCSVFDFYYTFLSLDLTFFVENFIATLVSAKTDLPVHFQSYWVKWKSNASKFDCFAKNCEFHLEGSNVCRLNATF